MLGNFDSFLSENRRSTQGGKIYPAFGQVFVELGAIATDFSKNKGVETKIQVMEKANELKSIMQTKLFEDVSIDSDKFDINLSENVSAVNMLMENEFLACESTELAQLKGLMMVSEHRLPNLVVRGDLNTVVSEAIKLGYSKSSIHCIIPANEMTIEMADSDRQIIESMSFDGRTASELLAEASTINLGDVYVTMNDVKSKAELSEMREIKLKSGAHGMTLGALNRHVMSNFVVKEARDTSYATDVVKDTGLPMLEGFKAYDIKRDVTMIEHAQNSFSKDIATAPLSATAWSKLLEQGTVYFANGWKLKHNNTSIVLTNAKHAMRAGRTCKEYRVELSEAGYPLLDMINMMQMSEQTRWDCDAFAHSLMKFDGAVTPERQKVVAFVTESAANRVFHPHLMSELRPVEESVNDVDTLIRAIANDQFKSFKLGQSFSESMLDKETTYSMMENIVENGIDVKTDGDLLTFKVNATEYHIELDIK